MADGKYTRSESCRRPARRRKSPMRRTGHFILCLPPRMWEIPSPVTIISAQRGQRRYLTHCPNGRCLSCRSRTSHTRPSRYREVAEPLSADRRGITANSMRGYAESAAVALRASLPTDRTQATTPATGTNSFELNAFPDAADRSSRSQFLPAKRCCRPERACHRGFI